MLRDPIVEQVRRAGRQLEKEAGGDVHRFFENLRAAQARYRERLVKRVPRRRSARVA